MTSSVEVGFHTVPSNWVGPFSSDTAEPFRRVVGIEHGDGIPSVDWSRVRDHPLHPDSDYDRHQASLEVIEMPELTAGRLISFYRRFFANEPQTLTQYNRYGLYKGELQEFANCHRFGYWMSGTPTAQEFDCPPAPDHITERHPVAIPLQIGRRGVLGTLGASVHSVIGLGEREECLQVMAAGGHMGIDTYDNIVDYYDLDRARGMQFYA